MAGDTPDRLTDALRSVTDALGVLKGYDDDALVDALKRLEVVPADVATGTNRIGSAAARVAADADPDSDDPACSFCFKGRSQVPFVVAGPGVAICNECVDTCNRILGSFDTGPSSRDPQPGAFARLARWLAR